MLKFTRGMGLASMAAVVTLAGAASPAIAQTLYVANAATDNVTVIRPNDGGVVATISVGDTPQSIAVSPNGSTVYVANAASNTVSVISAAQRQVVATYPVGDQPYHLVVSPDGARLYVANYSSGTVSVLNAETGNSITTLAVAPKPIGLTLSKNGSKLAVGYYEDSDVDVYDTSDFSLFDDTTITPHSYPGKATSDANKMLFTSGSTLYLYDSVAKTYLTEGGFGTPHTTTYNATTDQYAVANYQGGEIYLGNAQTLAKGRTILTDEKVSGVAFNASGTILYATFYGTHNDHIPKTVRALNTSDGSTIIDYTVGGNPTAIAYYEPTPATVPTLTEWAMILFGVVLAGFAAVSLQRRRQAA